MAKAFGRAESSRYIQSIPAALEKKVLRGAAKAAAAVIADEVRDRTNSDVVRAGIITRTKTEIGRITVRVTVKKGWAYSLALWAEYGTSPHFISVDPSQRDGKSVRRINEQEKDGSLLIGNQFVGATVRHPGAQAVPLFRPSLDIKRGEAITAAQGYINTRLAREGLGGPDVPEDS